MTSQYLRSRLSSFREYLTPISHTSTFATTGEITPEEFVKAGDYLVYRFPTWQWSPADDSKGKDFLPLDKQFLVTRHVPCYVRAADYEFVDGNGEDDNIHKDDDKLDNEGWTVPQSANDSTKLPHKHINIYDEEVDDAEERSIKEVSDDDDDIKDIDELIDENAEDVEFIDNKLNKNTPADPKSSKKRSYDLYITYSTSYRVPKMYLVGFDSNSVPLTPEQMFEDIASDYRHKTVTIEKAPFLNNTTSVSIHPCKHATVMKVLMKRAAASARERSHNKETENIMRRISHLGLKDHEPTVNDNQQEGGKVSDADDDADADAEWEDLKGEGGGIDEGIRVDQYLIVFLKFISSVIPGIEHDYTMEAL
ncbi:E2-like enzyme [Pichia californica]|uniref:Autophagy-related protein 3 n=1 Tax=Pichia californica TaxID=460514 RepID=A0A9P6WK96_9ASCO|nr:E2-like enzyme [[Candida] californica]KAG0688511.1 E2-like enzyme [[Candida] californica]